MRFWGKCFVAVMLLVSSSTYAFTISLQSGQWYLLSIPGDTNVAVSEMFDGQLNAADSGETWALLAYDNQQQTYVEISGDSLLNPGVGFWFQQNSGSAVELVVDVYAPSVPLSVASPCESPFGCFDFSLPTDNVVRWSLIGTPFPEGVDIRDVSLVTDAGPCSNGCTIQQAFDAELSGDSFYRYDAANNEYVALSSDDMLIAGESYWFPTIIAPSAGSARLVIPTYCTPFT